MRRIRKIGAAFLVWAAAASMLLGATPHLICRCPDGTIKHFCFGQSRDGSCCSAAKCCSASQEKKRSCCHESSKASSKGRRSCCSQGGASESGGGQSRARDRQPVVKKAAHPGVDGPALGATSCQKSLEKS